MNKASPIVAGVAADHGRSPVMRRRRLRRVAVGIIAIAVVVAAGVAAASGTGKPKRGSAVAAPGPHVMVRRGMLADAVKADGTLAYGPESGLRLKGAGTVTWLPPAGTILVRGAPVARVDDRQVTLLLGPLPMYRPLSAGVVATSAEPPEPPTRGNDVKQLKDNLRALGYSSFSSDDVYSASVAAAVKRWQRSMGAPETGVVGVGDVVYADGPLRVSRVLVRPGDAAAGGDAMMTTATARVVTVEAPPATLAWANPGAAVTILLPDGRAIGGRVTGTASPVERDSGSRSATEAAASLARVGVEPDDQGRLDTFGEVPVTVQHVLAERRDVLIVPVVALVALAEGGYGLEIAAGGVSRYIAVRTGLFAGADVEVAAPELREGLQVAIPE
jgi:peptidoglycan hydrolase-like protein with peptidoglycan-binding domain